MLSVVYAEIFEGAPKQLRESKTAKGEAAGFFANFFYKFKEVLLLRGALAECKPSPYVR